MDSLSHQFTTSESIPQGTLNVSTHRLLYRGALSLPDSHLLLDGLSFTAALKRPGESANTIYDSSFDLLNHPLALALESMRGRPSLHLLGTVKLGEVWIDEKSIGVVQLDVHPKAALSRLYFENVFCLEPIISKDGKSEYGVRVSLSDSNDPSSSDILIYAQLQSSDLEEIEANHLDSPSTTTLPKILRLLVARILPGPPPVPAPPRPRPDDPTPRVPSVFSSYVNTKHKREGSPSTAKRSKIREKEKRKEFGNATHTFEKGRETMTRPLRPPSSAAPNKGSKNADFKVPQVPRFVGTSSTQRDERKRINTPRSMAEATFDMFAVGDSVSSPDEQEKTNKTVIKKAVVRCLADHAINKQHPEFNDIFGHVYQGTCFAMRAQMRNVPVDLWNVYKFVDAHAKMYLHSGSEGPGPT
ncbi:uncharacterized protein LAESUDRAFT_683130 [Laetiporus sulphureus 93-53]|uniref:Sld7 C-terminal domain-containing protein n=1 Tax=Laetiporus sulphureus 93-53 TaxID=1314785 RepID=A0A165D171_9APHY|nr:uncharacterized protein LAESUDRAFT_683130 [Laetiporus sulphureus 93-53]KZT03935.1 hypothetical protein LAESUDRAFT_683130 [Laetiporus sulphureus 93-53]